MKWSMTILFLAIILIFLVKPTYGDRTVTGQGIIEVPCRIDYLINIELSGDYSSFPDFIEDDILFLRNVTITNLGDCISPEVDFTIWTESESGIEKNFGFNIRNKGLPPNTSITNLNGSYGIRLDELGRWKVLSKIEILNAGSGSYGSSLKINDTWLNAFTVHSRLEFQSLDLAERAAQAAIAAVWLSIIAVSIIIIDFFWRLGLEYRHKREEEGNIEILKEIKEILKNIENLLKTRKKRKIRKNSKRR